MTKRIEPSVVEKKKKKKKKNEDYDSYDDSESDSDDDDETVDEDCVGSNMIHQISTYVDGCLEWHKFLIE